MKARKTVRRRGNAGQQLRRQWREFVQRIHESVENQDALAVEAVTETFRAAVRRAAEEGVEASVTWHSLGMWTWNAQERLDCFSRALKCLAREETQHPPTDDLERWTYAHYNALCRFELANTLAGAGRISAARTFLEEALPFARAAEDMPFKGETAEGNLEGRIAGELLLLDVWD